MSNKNEHDAQSLADGAALAGSLLVRCHTLLKELEEFRCFIEKNKPEREHAVDIRKFQVSVSTEYKSLQKVLYTQPNYDS